jgi:regulator of protease activity HflC (stomatin/prohibitin superfamily)
MIAEKSYRPPSGWIFLFVFLVLIIGAPIWLAYSAASSPSPRLGWIIVCVIVAELIGFVGMFGFMAIQPNQARVLMLFGDYVGTVIESGFFWANPFFSKKKISLRVRNFETGSSTTPEIKDAAGHVTQQKTRTTGRPSKVNDRDGNPVDISAVVVWKVVNTAEAMFEVDDYEDFLSVQCEAALRILASRHPYDSEDHQVSLRGNTTEVSAQLRTDIQERLEKAGIQVVEARISHLAYAQEIAAAMLRRQQAQAVVAARTKIVEGAVGMVKMALDHLTNAKIVELNDERRAELVSNLLVVLCSDSHTQPIINTGTKLN